ncbi:dihydrolipoamide dehydrogenase [Pseudooceanicola batsensis HTCC2597]|uniref:Dihydrolipoamide dehydrogenase n=1 Tax=Pseudooceanicola batsensis (strain ATCC BAA-863 / DSM 15984 / KCTC 12145 / HTCC2597) TaxID=252305 RepID=A3U315_PSEBH|nr:dihydrolipoyl dehydrogenase [Pseudooceanicola batsensis]EAQ01545.1 dihydrolipoamide dehydrogenase [Pseudooceanicola batsensis HTCC2597]
MTTFTTDVAVIGAGTAGLAAERHARETGATTRLIDPAFAGTTCATVGCMPSKLLIAAADAAHGARQAGEFGITAEPRVDGPAVLRRLRAMRDDFARGVRQSIDALPEGTCLKARARFEAPGILALDTGDRVEARAVVIATGATPALPGPYEDVRDRVLTNETVFELEDLPESLGVIGAGPLGLEMAQAMHRLGVRVEVFDAGDRLAGLPSDTSDALHEVLTRSFPVHLDCKPEPSADGDGVTLKWDGGQARFARLLVAAGRPPALSGLDLEKAELELDDHGTPVFDAATMQCGDAPVFIAGDANHDRPLLHEASDEGTVAGRNAAAWPELRRAARKVPLSISFTRPEAAVIGAIPEGDGHVCGEIDFSDQGRAKVEGRNHGLARLHARAGDGRLVGASLCAPGGEQLAHLLAWAIQCEMTASDMLDLPFYHPVLAEGLQTALRDICRQAGLERPWQRDDTPLPGSNAGAAEE